MAMTMSMTMVLMTEVRTLRGEAPSAQRAEKTHTDGNEKECRWSFNKPIEARESNSNKFKRTSNVIQTNIKESKARPHLTMNNYRQGPSPHKLSEHAHVIITYRYNERDGLS